MGTSGQEFGTMEEEDAWFPKQLKNSDASLLEIWNIGSSPDHKIDAVPESYVNASTRPDFTGSVKY